jgi:hypothetical protein
VFKVYKFQVSPIHPPLGDFHLHWSFLETVTGFLKLVELCKGLVVLPYLASLVQVYGIHDPLADG